MLPSKIYLLAGHRGATILYYLLVRNEDGFMDRRLLLLCFLCGELRAATPLIVSHRAGMGHFSQASPAAIQYSIALGIDFVELDLRLTADDVPVVHHDPEINPQLCAWRDGGTPPAGLAIADLPLARLKALRCGIGINQQFPDQIAVTHNLLTLREALALIALQDTQINLMLELKSVGLRKTRRFVRKVLTIVRESGLSHRVNLQSADLRISGLFKHSAAWHKIPLMANIVAAPAQWITSRRVAVLQRLGKRVVAYTVNNPQQWENLLQAGVDGLITDTPRTLKEFLDRRAHRFSQANR